MVPRATDATEIGRFLPTVPDHSRPLIRPSTWPIRSPSRAPVAIPSRSHAVFLELLRPVCLCRCDSSAALSHALSHLLPILSLLLTHFPSRLKSDFLSAIVPSPLVFLGPPSSAPGIGLRYLSIAGRLIPNGVDCTFRQSKCRPAQDVYWPAGFTLITCDTTSFRRAIGRFHSSPVLQIPH
ncbi:hypothetical protein GGR52DRAFT_326113 [Hypoxylon sp. FL1284]|nr:hypothetical protein GGR52DRAFT_326113 [Hypoxylon sp. FL1284]